MSLLNRVNVLPHCAVSWTISALAYFLLGELGLRLAIPPGFASAVFPAAAVAVVATLLVGRCVLPAIWLGSFVLNLSVVWQNQALSDSTIGMAAWIACGACAQGALAAGLVRWRLQTAWQSLERDRDIIWFLLLAGPVACLLSSSWGLLALWYFKVIAVDELPFSWWNWWAGDSLGVLLFAPMLLNVFYRRQALWQARIRGVVWPTLLLTLATVVVYVHVSDKEYQAQKARFEGYGHALASSIDQQLKHYQQTVGDLASLLSIAPQLKRSEFSRFVLPMLAQTADIHALSWNPVVTWPQRRAFEARLAQENAQAAFYISERNASQTLVSAGQRDWYVPVSYIEPIAANAKALGFDIASNQARLDTIHAAIASGKMTATPPIKLVQDQANQKGLLLLQPVYSNRPEQGDLPLGFAVGVFKVEAMLQTKTHQSLPAYLGVRLADTAVPGAEGLIFDNQLPVATGGQSLTWQQSLDFAGRQWQLSVYQTAQYLAQERSLFAWSVLATGLIVASMLQVTLLGMTGRAFAIQRTVKQQTLKIVDQANILQENQQRLQQEKDKYETLMHASWDGIHILDRDGRVVDANQRFCDLLGYQRAEIIGLSVTQWSMLPPEQALARVRANFATATVFETRHRRKDGQVIDVEVSSRAILIANQWLLWNASRDISERKRLQLALEQAKETAENLAELKSRFLANMSHEIRTPMNGIIGLTQLSLEQPMSDELRGYLQKILLSAQTLLSILNDILDLSKIEAGQMTLESLGFDLPQLVATLHHLFSPMASDKQLSFEVEVPSDLPRHLLGDARRLQQVLINLVSNAIKFTQQGTVKLALRIVSQQAERICIEFSVTDTGIGIEPELIGKLFKPFSQVDDSISRRFGGSGLGLVISRDLLKLMGSEIQVSSQPGQGSRFCFQIGFDVDISQSTGSPQSAPAGQGKLSAQLQIKSQPLQGKRILVAEDNAINQVVIGQFLKLMGLSYQMVANGEAALASLQAQAFDAVLMDVGMPVMDGREATRRIRQNPAWRDLPVIALSAGITESERAECDESGMDDFIGKPIDPQAFLATLLKHLA